MTSCVRVGPTLRPGCPRLPPHTLLSCSFLSLFVEGEGFTCPFPRLFFFPARFIMAVLFGARHDDMRACRTDSETGCPRLPLHALRCYNFLRVSVEGACFTFPVSAIVVLFPFPDRYLAVFSYREMTSCVRVGPTRRAGCPRLPLHALRCYNFLRVFV